MESQQRQQCVAPRKVSSHTFLDEHPVLIPKLVVLLRVIFGKGLEFSHHFPNQCFLDSTRCGVLLDGLARYVERQVLGLDHAFDKAQVVRK